MTETNPILHKLNYYLKWWKKMDLKERETFIGIWVKERIMLLSEALYWSLDQAA